MTTLDQIERQSKFYADARGDLCERVSALNAELEAVRKRHLRGVKAAVAKAAEMHADLKVLLEGSEHLFVKPKTVIFHGIKVGFAKGKGAIDFKDAQRVVALIRKHLADQADVLIKTTEKPVKKALANLDVNSLKKIGCTVEETGDTVYIAAVDNEVDKLVDALLKASVHEDQQADES